ncbi:MAG: FAD:protein transferase [Microbacteriaceae bacterium]|nr:FAD:protein transferase [Microbacteriaceae bacterium]
MGTMVSLSVEMAAATPDGGADEASSVRRANRWDAARTSVHDAFRAFDERFSLYREDSELSRVARGEVELTQSSDEMRETYELAVRWRSATAGAFSPDRPDGVLDLNGIVKAIAIDRAGRVLSDAGAENWCINAGGDILYRGAPEPGTHWVTGITDPSDPANLLTSIELFGEHVAVATSGYAQRGQHIWHRGAQRNGFVQVTVMASDIVTADVLATAVLATPPAEVGDLLAEHAVDLLAVDATGNLTATPRLRDYFVRP